MSRVPRIAAGMSRGRQPGRAGIRLFAAVTVGLLAWMSWVPAGSESTSVMASPDVLGRGRQVYEIWALVFYLDSLVPMEHRVSPLRALGEEPRGWMVVRMHGMMGGMMGPGMMRGMPVPQP